MDDAQFVMVSEWMVNGNINQLLKVRPHADRLGLVCLLSEAWLFHVSLTLNRLTSVAERCWQGAGLLARSGNDPRRSQGGRRLYTSIALLAARLFSLTYLKANILIDHEDHARIADFGLLTLLSDQMGFISSISHEEGGTPQWMSPELLDPGKFGLKDGCPTKESDCYALGMVIYEVLSGQAPFPRCKVPSLS